MSLCRGWRGVVLASASMASTVWGGCAGGATAQASSGPDTDATDADATDTARVSPGTASHGTSSSTTGFAPPPEAWGCGDTDCFDTAATPLSPVLDPECPRADELLGVPVPVGVRVTGRVTQAGRPSKESFYFVSVGDAGRVDVIPADDGRYEVFVLPGRYDVEAIGLASGLPRDVDMTGETTLDVDLPAKVTLRGVMTRDGRGVADSFSSLALVPIPPKTATTTENATGIPPAQPVPLGPMNQLDYAVEVWPGHYSLSYNSCLRLEELPGLGLFCRERVGESKMITARVLTDLDLRSDTTLDLDVQTAHIHGDARVDGATPDSRWTPLYFTGEHLSEGVAVLLGEDGTFDVRLPVGPAQVHLGPTSGVVVSGVAATPGDVDLPLRVTTTTLKIDLVDRPWLADAIPRALVYARLAGALGAVPASDAAVRVVPGRYQLTYDTAGLPPDRRDVAPGTYVSIGASLEIELDVREDTTLAVDIPVCRFRLDLDAPRGRETLKLARDPRLGNTRPFVLGQTSPVSVLEEALSGLEVHSLRREVLLLPGWYTIDPDPNQRFEVRDRTWLLQRDSWVKLGFFASMGGVPTSLSALEIVRRGMTRSPSTRLETPRADLSVGTYDVYYHGPGYPPPRPDAPHNTGARIGCFRVEG